MTTAMTVPTPRQPVPAKVLHDWIDAKITEQFDLAIQKPGHQFSAWDITLLLRSDHPEYEIVHDEVRERVHYVMAAWPKPYTTDHSNAWLLYIPQPVTVSRVVPNSTPKQLPGIIINWEDDK